MSNVKKSLRCSRRLPAYGLRPLQRHVAPHRTRYGGPSGTDDEKKTVRQFPEKHRPVRGVRVRVPQLASGSRKDGASVPVGLLYEAHEHGPLQGVLRGQAGLLLSAVEGNKIQGMAPRGSKCGY